MFPFHKIYLKIFASLDFDVERKLLRELQEQGINKFLAIKRSWIYALKLSLIAVLGAILIWINAILGFIYFDGILEQVLIPGFYVLVGLLLLSDTFWYMWSYREAHKEVQVQTDICEQIKKNDIVNKNFIRFFNISVLVSLLLFLLLLETLVYGIFFYSGDNIIVFGSGILLNILASFCIFKHRRLSMNLELDFSLVIPGKIYVIDQTGLLSSKQTIVAVNIKTVEGVYASIFGSLLRYGDIKIFLEGNIPGQKGVMVLDYIRSPRITVDLINKFLS